MNPLKGDLKALPIKGDGKGMLRGGEARGDLCGSMGDMAIGRSGDVANGDTAISLSVDGVIAFIGKRDSTLLFFLFFLSSAKTRVILSGSGEIGFDLLLLLGLRSVLATSLALSCFSSVLLHSSVTTVNEDGTTGQLVVTALRTATELLLLKAMLD